MTIPTAMIRVKGDPFGHAAACLGSQLVAVLAELSTCLGVVHWYYTDVSTNGKNPFASPGAEQFGLFADTSTFMVHAKQVDQFLTGVFFAVPREKPNPQLREKPETDDPVGADMGDAIVEIRAFDTTYLEVSATDEALLKPLAKRFQCEYFCQADLGNQTSDNPGGAR